MFIMHYWCKQVWYWHTMKLCCFVTSFPFYKYAEIYCMSKYKGQCYVSREFFFFFYFSRKSHDLWLNIEILFWSAERAMCLSWEYFSRMSHDLPLTSEIVKFCFWSAEKHNRYWVYNLCKIVNYAA